MAKAFIACFLVLVVVAAAISIYLQIKHNNSNHHSVKQNFNATVSKNRPGAYNTVMDAIAAAPVYSQTRYYIHVEAGLYIERVEVWENKTNIALVGDGELTTKISWNRRAPDFYTLETATIVILGAGFTGKFLTFENSAGDGSQAVAVASLSNMSAFYKCTFLGYQDTLYAKQYLQFYRECNIYGTVDFIFGAAAAVFQSCNMFSRLPRTSTFTAQQKQDKRSSSGFVIQNCGLTVAPGMEQQKFSFKAYLGRPWSNYSTVVVMESYLDSIIQPEGWLEWENRTTSMLTYVEYNNRGPGASTTSRVDWEGYKSASQKDEVQKFTVGEFIGGDEWLPSTGIPYSRGFMI